MVNNSPHTEALSIFSLQFLTSRGFSTAAKKFKVLGVQQIAIGGLDKALLSKFWVDTMGVTKVGDYKSEVIDMISMHTDQQFDVFYFRKRMWMKTYWCLAKAQTKWKLI